MTQSTLLRKMSGEDRLQQAFELSNFVRELALKNIKSRLSKNATQKQIRDALYKIIYGRTARHSITNNQNTAQI